MVRRIHSRNEGCSIVVTRGCFFIFEMPPTLLGICFGGGSSHAIVGSSSTVVPLRGFRLFFIKAYHDVGRIMTSEQISPSSRRHDTAHRRTRTTRTSLSPSVPRGVRSGGCRAACPRDGGRSRRHGSSSASKIFSPLLIGRSGRGPSGRISFRATRTRRTLRRRAGAATRTGAGGRTEKSRSSGARGPGDLGWVCGIGPAGCVGEGGGYGGRIRFEN